MCETCEICETCEKCQMFETCDILNLVQLAPQLQSNSICKFFWLTCFATGRAHRSSIRQEEELMISDLNLAKPANSSVCMY